MHKLEAKQVTKVIKGACVLKEINLQLEGGSVNAFQGENGCGKSMLFRVLSGLSKPTEGVVCLDGDNIHGTKKKAHSIGIVLENASLFPQFTAMENLQYLAKINGLIGKPEIEQALQRVGLEPGDKRTVRKFSLGMRQRLLIAQAIMESPDFLFLDEPTNAIDKAGVELVYEIIRREAERGAVVLMASHIDKDVAGLADRRFLMSGGEIVREE